MADTPLPSLDETLGVLRAAAEETRLRILALLVEGELSVSDLTDILGQSQPRISRHLKLLVEAGLVERHREGAWAFFRLTDRGAALRIIRPTLESLDRSDPQLLEDRTRLEAVRTQRAQAAQAFFWGRARSATSSISAPAPAACCSCWRPAPSARSGWMPAMPCSPSPVPIWKRW